MTARQTGTAGRDFRANSANAIPPSRFQRSSRIDIPLLSTSSVLLLMIGCTSTTPFSLDPFAQNNLAAESFTMHKLDDGALIGQFVLSNKTDSRLGFRYQWIWMDESGIALNHAMRRWKIAYLEPLEEKFIQSRTSHLEAKKCLIRISAIPRH